MEFAENKDLFQTVFDSAPNGIAVLQAIVSESGKVEDFSMLLLNAHTRKRIGDVDYKGKRYGQFFPALKENGTLQKFVTVAESGISASFEGSDILNGKQYWFRYTAVKQAELLVVTTEDISERKAIELALHNVKEETEKQQRLYYSITNNTPDLVYVFDLQYNFSYANKALLDMWGKSAEEAIGKGLRENGYEEWHAKMHENEIDTIVATKKSIRGTVSFPHAELGSRVYDYILVPVLNGDGDVEAVAGTTRDITEIKQTEEKLLLSEARFRNMLQEAPVAATLFRGPDFTIEIANELTQRYWGKDKKIVGKTLAEAAPELEGQNMIALLQNIYQHGGTENFAETPITFLENGKWKDGYYSFSLKSLTNSQGHIDSILSIGIDVTDQVRSRKKIEESESRLKLMIDQTPAPTLVLMGDELVVEQINKPMMQMIGHGEEVIGHPLISFMPELKGQYIWEQVEKVYREGIPFDQQEVKVTHNRAGVMKDFYYNIAYRPLRDEGVITGMIQVAIEVTDQVCIRKKLEESQNHYKVLSESLEQQVNERTKELQRSNSDLQQFAHVASHDLKEPVRKIKTFISRLEQQLQGKLNETEVRYIERIHVAADRMFNMIDGVLSYSKTNADTKAPEPVNLNEVISNIESDLEIILQKTGAKIHHADLPTLEGAPVLLYQLFYNLINNSIKFAKADVPPLISISSEETMQGDQRFARITLQDNGIGFEAEQADKIFDTFTRLNAKDKYEGTGLGLSLCKKIAERHGGNISASAVPDQGASFVVSLPLQQVASGI